MAEKQDLKDAPVKDELQVAVSQDTSLRKVELDLDDAPFLVEQAPPPPAKTEEAPLQVADEGAEPPKKKKKLLIIAAAAGLLVLLVAGAAIWWFVLRTPHRLLRSQSSQRSSWCLLQKHPLPSLTASRNWRPLSSPGKPPRARGF